MVSEPRHGDRRPGMLSRRELLRFGGSCAAALSGCGMPRVPAVPPPAFARHEILMLVYPRFTTLDLIGPQHVFSLLGAEFRTRLVWKDRSEIVSDTGVPVRPTMTYAECRPNPTVLFVPGGTDGTLRAMEDDEVRGFVSTMGAAATFVTSVCTGSLVLGAAGLLDGYRATSHWLALDALRLFGATPVAERVVVDRNRVTGAGVTAGIDFALTLVSRLKDDAYAKTVQLMMEYDPQPPFDSGSPAAASPESVDLLEAMAEPFLTEVQAVAERIGGR
jgi:cyclohexyl-isocyanide hydratase